MLATMAQGDKKEIVVQEESGLYKLFSKSNNAIIPVKKSNRFEIYLLIYGLTYRGEGNGTKGAIGPKGEKGDKGEGPFVPKGPIGR